MSIGEISLPNLEQTIDKKSDVFFEDSNITRTTQSKKI